MGAKVTISNANVEALEITKYREYGKVVVEGAKDGVETVAEISVDPVIWYSEAEQKEYYIDTYGDLPGVTVTYVPEEEPKGSIQFYVTDAADDSALAGVSISSTSFTAVTTAASTGAAKVENLNAGTVSVKFTKSGYTTINSKSVKVNSGSETAVYVSMVATEG